MLAELLPKYGFLILALVLICLAVLAVYLVRRSEARSGRRSVWSYLLIWPILFDDWDKAATQRPALKRRVLIGWLIVIFLVLIGILIHPSSR